MGFLILSHDDPGNGTQQEGRLCILSLVTLADRLRLLAFDLTLLGWSAREVAIIHEAAYRLSQGAGGAENAGASLRCAEDSRRSATQAARPVPSRSLTCPNV